MGSRKAGGRLISGAQSARCWAPLFAAGSRAPKPPFIALAREIPEQQENSADEHVDDQSERRTRRARLAADCIHDLGDPESKYEMKMGPAHGENRIQN